MECGSLFRQTPIHPRQMVPPPAWAQRSDGVWTPIATSQPRFQTNQVYIDHAKTKRYQGVVAEKRIQRAERKGLHVKVEYVSDNTGWTRIRLSPMNGCPHLTSQKTQKWFWKKGYEYHVTVSHGSSWNTLWKQSPRQWRVAVRRERAIRRRVVAGVTKIYLQHISRDSSVARVTHDSRGLIPWALIGAQRMEAGGHSFQSTVSL